MDTILVVSDDVENSNVQTICEVLEKNEFTVIKASLEDSDMQAHIVASDAIITVVNDDFDTHALAALTFRKKCRDNSRKMIVYGPDEKVSEVKKVFREEVIAGEINTPVSNEDIINSLSDITNTEESVVEQKHILVVDDSGTMLRTAMKWFENKYKVSVANSAIVAKNIIEKGKPDLILLDYEMPIYSGPKFLKNLREDEKTKDIPVIFLTSQSDAGSVKAVLDLKPQGYILKTTPSEIILDKIEDFFRKSM